jgi:Tfp pilus assembly protein PilF
MTLVRGRRTRQGLAVGALLAALVLAVFAPVGSHPFAPIDDRDYLTENPGVAAGLSVGGVRWAFTTFHAANWHPLTWLSHQLDVQLFGLRPGPHHLVSLAVHVAATLALFAALALATGKPAAAALAAALFGVHPLHVEPVVWLAERKELLSTLCGLLAVLAWWWYARRPGVGRYLVAAAAFALGLLAKPMLVTLPLALLLLDVWPLGRLGPGLDPRRLPALIAEKAPLLALSAASSAATLAAQRAGQTVISLGALPAADRVANALVAPLVYLRQALWPAGLAVYYPHAGGSIPWWAAAGAALALAAASAGAVLALRRRPWLAAGWFWYLGTLVPVVGIVQVGLQGHADRYTYLPLVGPFVAAAWELDRVARSRRAARAAVAALSVLAVAALAVVARAQVDRWRDPRVLLASAIAATGDNWLAQLDLGVSLLDAGLPAEALPHLEEARRLQPFYADAHYDVALAYAALGRHAEAAASYAYAARIRPGDADTWNNLGTELDALGRYEEAVARYREAIRLAPGFVAARENLARTLARLGRGAEAQREFNEALRLRGLRRAGGAADGPPR